MRLILVALLLLSASCASSPVAHRAPPISSAPSAAQQLNVYFGNLHAHTSYSDGSGEPDEAFTYARDVAGLDFMAITEHNHDGVGQAGHSIATNPDLYRDLIAAAGRQSVAGSFVALYGQEFSTIEHGNHSNIIGVDEVIDEDDVPNGNYGRLLRTWLPAHTDPFGDRPVMLLNHPSQSSSANGEEYGRDDFSSETAWVNALDQHAMLINMINGPSHDENRPPGAPSEGEFLRYLNLGVHVAPTADQDNHLRNWGRAARTRTGIVASALSAEALFEAMRERRVYATQDENLAVIVRVAGNVMGSRVDASGVGPMFEVSVTLNDENEPDARYLIEIFSDTIGGTARARVVETATAEGDGEWIVEGIPATGAGQYVFVRITQSGRDQVWTAPVWFE